MSGVTCHMSSVTFHVSYVTCHMPFNLGGGRFLVEPVVEGSVMNGATPSSYCLIPVLRVYWVTVS